MKVVEQWAVWSFHETHDGRRYERVIALTGTLDKASAYVARITTSEATDEALPHMERSRLFIKRVVVDFVE